MLKTRVERFLPLISKELVRLRVDRVSIDSAQIRRAYIVAKPSAIVGLVEVSDFGAVYCNSTSENVLHALRKIKTSEDIDLVRYRIAKALRVLF